MAVHQRIDVAHKNVFCALAAAQMEMEPLKKGAINPAFKGEGKPKGTPYADLADVVLAVRGPLNRHGLAFFHQVLEGNVMRTSIVHGESETRIDCDVPLLVDRQNMQGMKSATTYAKRIGLESVTGVAPDDDDGNAAAAAPLVERSAPRQERPKPFDPVAKADSMIATIRDKGLHMTQHPRFNEAMGELRAADAESAARVEAEIDTLKASANADLGADAIPH